jgi:hypothetical protein
MNNNKEENDWIKRNCKLRCNWNPVREQWTVKISTTEKDVASVEVVANGFENFRLASDKAILQFRRNLRNEVKSNVIMKMSISEDEYAETRQERKKELELTEWWPDQLETTVEVEDSYAEEKSDFSLDNKS